MGNDLRFDGRVAIVTGAGAGLGRAHALLLASRGARVVVNDLGGSMHGGGKSSAAADAVVAEIKAAGGEAVANYDSVEDGAKIVQTALDTWKRIDIVVNNAGILRDTSFQKMSEEDWELIYRVHVLGSFRVTHAAWNAMRDAGYGRIVFTASAAGIYGNFGQANYSMAKLGLVGLSNTLAVEGKKKNVLVNTIAPLAGSRLTETVLPKEVVDALKPEFVSPLVAWLCHESCESTGGLYEVGGGFFARLRWERAAGKTFKIGRPVTPEGVRDAWGAIAGFEKATHPSDITSSMQPVLANLQSRSKGGNDLIDLDEALGYEYPPVTTSHDERDLALYALGVGAGRDPLDGKDLRLVYEMHPEGFLPLPTFGAVAGINAIIELAKQGQVAPGTKYGVERILHGEEYLEVRGPLPPKGKLTHKAKVRDIFDKGKHALVVNEIRSYDESGREVFLSEASWIVRGAGGWGGDRGPAAEANAPPDRKPDAVVEERTSENQALLYRLNGDINPLHADPAFAKSFGFEKPILHGMCTFGHAARHVIRSLCDGDPRRLKSIRVRFADTVVPGETLVTEMWKLGGGKVVFRCSCKERGKTVIGNAVAETWDRAPEWKPAQAAAAAAGAGQAAAPAAAAGPTSADIFSGIQFHVETHPELVAQVATVFQFKIRNPDSSWVIDLKSGKGSVSSGSAEKPDVTLELSEEDFVAMSTGKANPQKLYFAGKLKISGNVMASQKLLFLKDVDPNKVVEAMRKAGRLPGGAGAQAAPAAAAPATEGEPSSADLFAAVADHIARHPDLVGKVQTVFQMKLTDPDSAWIIDVKSGSGSVAQGVADKPDVTLTLADADWIAIATRKADAQKLYFSGKLKISGNIMASQKLMFLKDIDPEAAKAAIVRARAAGGAPAAAAAAPKPKAEPRAPAVFRALADRIAKTPGLVGDVGAVVGFRIREPDGQWAVDLAKAPGGVREGAAQGAAATIGLSEEDLVAIVGGASPQDLFQRGRLRVDGDVRVARKLGFLKGLA